MLAEKVASVEFEGTIHITHMYSKGHTYQYLPAPGVEFTHPGILTIDAISEHSIIAVNKREEALQVMDIELSIGVHEKSEVFSGGFEATNQCRTVSLVDRVMDDSHPRISRSNGVYNHTRSIPASIV